jgi:hypothetical protein
MAEASVNTCANAACVTAHLFGIHGHQLRLQLIVANSIYAVAAKAAVP